MSELFANGPISCSMGVDNDFLYKYAGGIYHDKNNVTELDHDVEVVGWGEQTNGETQEKYWLCRNSHGSYFGHNGFFLLPRGINSMRIEEKCLFATPDVSELEAHLRGETVGSMFGLILPGEKPQTKPDGWKKMTHDFPTKKEEAEEAREEKQQEKWVKKFVPQPDLELRGSIVEPSFIDAKRTVISGLRGSIVEPSFIDAKMTVISGWNTKWVIMIAGFVAVLVGAIYLYLRSQRSHDYDSIPAYST
jgi:hypothetical protein